MHAHHRELAIIRLIVIACCIVVGVGCALGFVVIQWRDKRRAQRKHDDILARYDAEFDFVDDPDWARNLRLEQQPDTEHKRTGDQ